MMNKIVIHFQGGETLKGITNNFFPNKETFILHENESGMARVVHLRHLKAVFFVKTFEGNPDYQEKTDCERVGYGRKIQIIFKDGETLNGHTQGFTPERLGFFFFPADPESNNERIFVVTMATREITFVLESVSRSTTESVARKPRAACFF